MTNGELEIFCAFYGFQVLIFCCKNEIVLFSKSNFDQKWNFGLTKLFKGCDFMSSRMQKNRYFSNFKWMEFTKAQFYAFHNLSNEILHNFEKRHCLDLGHCKLLPVQWRKIVSLLQTQWNFCLAHKLKTRLYLMAQPIFFCFQLLLYGHCRSSRLTELNSKPYPPKILVAGKMVAPDLFYGTRNGRRKIGRRANGDLCTFSNVYIGLY